jgi:hypothetical protein
MMKLAFPWQSIICASIFVAAAFMLSGCMLGARTMMVNGYAEPQAQFDLLPGAMFTVEPDEKAANPILAQQIARKLEMALNNSGWRVLSGQDAPMVLTFDFGQNKGTDTRTRAITEPGRTRTETIRDDKGRVTHREVESPPRTRYVREDVTVYDMWLKVKVAETASHKAIWIGESVYRSSSGDLRAAIDYMIAALVKIFGKDTKRQLRISINKSDPVMQMLIPATP